RPVDAVRVLRRGRQIRPADPQMLESMAEMMLEIGETPAAIEYAQQLLRVVPKSLPARDVLGVAYLQQGRVNEALRMADQMVTISPLDPGHHFKKAVLFQQQSMVREAVREFVQVLNLAPDSEMANEALMAIECLDNQLMRQVIMLAAEDALFRTQL